MTKPRIVSLIASATEIVSALGHVDELVGRSHECDHPASVLSLPECSRPRIDVVGSSKEIDDRVRVAARDALSVYEVFPERLEELRPTVILTQSHCEVCAVSLADVERAVLDVVSSRPQLVSLSPNFLADVWTSIRDVAAALDDVDAGERVVNESLERLSDLSDRTAALGSRPTIACLEWMDPLMTAGNWVPELVEIAGGSDLFGRPGVHSPYVAWEDVLREDPHVLAIMPCGFGIPRILEEYDVLSQRPGWSELQAVRNDRVFVVDGNQYFNRPGPRLVESAEILVEILHGDAFDFGHRESGWVRAGAVTD